MRTLVAGVIIAGSLSLFSLAQSGSLSPDERVTQARLLLQEAEGASRAFDPASRSIILYRAAGAWVALDRSQAIRLYRESFPLTGDLPASVRGPQQDAILNELLVLSPSEVLPLLADAETGTRNRLYAGLIKCSLFQGDLVGAVRTFDQAIANGIFPDEATTHLMATLSPNSEERAHVFAGVIHYCRQHPGRDKPLPAPCDSLAYLVARFYAQLPGTLVLQAIDAVLDRAQLDDKQHPNGTLGYGSGGENVQFHSRYDAQLFAVAPALQNFDASRAQLLLAQHPEAASALKRYPKGLVSVLVYDFSLNYAIPPTRFKPPDLKLWSDQNSNLNLTSLDMGLEFTIPRTPLPGVADLTNISWSWDPKSSEKDDFEKLKSCSPDLAKHLDLLQAVPLVRKEPVACSGPVVLPAKVATPQKESADDPRCSYRNTFPRAGMLEFIALGCTYINQADSARAALLELRETTRQVPEAERARYLASAADLYLRLGDRQAAAELTQEGFSLAASRYEEIQGSDILRKFPKGLWEPVQIYNTMIDLGVNASLDRTRRSVSEIPDPSLRELEQVMMARALLGVPIRRYILVGPQGGTMVAEGITYEHTFR